MAKKIPSTAAATAVDGQTVRVPYPLQRLYVCRSLTVCGPKPKLWSDGGLEAYAVIERTVGAATLGKFLH